MSLRTLGRLVGATALLAVAAGCGSEPRPTPRLLSGGQRQALLEHQIADFARREETWRGWFETLCAGSWTNLRGQEGRMRELVGREGMLFGHWDLQLLCNPQDLQEIADPLPPATDLSGHFGPLVSIVHFARQLESLGVDLLVVPIPPRPTVHPDLLPFPTPLAPGQSLPLLDRGLRELYLRLERHGVEVIDLLPTLLARRERALDGVDLPSGAPATETVFRRQDVHWATYGAGLAAEVIGRRVRRYPWYPATARRLGSALLVEEVVWRSAYGSIARQLRSQRRLAPDTAMEVFPKRRLRIEGERWSFGDRDSPVILLGDSFALPAQGLPDGLLLELGYRVDWISVPLGAQSSQLKALRLRGDRLAGKRLVIWEIAATAFLSQKRWQPIDVIGEEAATPAEDPPAP